MFYIKDKNKNLENINIYRVTLIVYFLLEFNLMCPGAPTVLTIHHIFKTY